MPSERLLFAAAAVVLIVYGYTEEGFTAETFLCQSSNNVIAAMAACIMVRKWTFENCPKVGQSFTILNGKKYQDLISTVFREKSHF